MSDLRFLANNLQGFGTTIFAEMSALAASTNSLNLGQGFPDYDGPSEVLDRARHEIAHGNNQYPPGPGIADLRSAIAEHQKRFWDIDLDPDTEVLVTTGATEALAGALLGTLNSGDEVIVLEPMYDSYQACIALAGARAVPVTLRPQSDGRYVFDENELRAAVTPRTRGLLVNTPHNPTGTVLTREELILLADVAVTNNLLVYSDEVYEHLTFDGVRHTPIATLPGMNDRTLTISSGGKTFNTTGWKIGWVSGPAEFVAACRTAKQFLTYVSGAPFQPAIAVGLRLPDSYFLDLAADLQWKRDVLFGGLHAAGLKPFMPQGTYFITVDIRGIRPDGDGMAFCRSLPERCGVVAIPNVVFYDPAHAHEGRHLVRFAFCKQPATIEAASRQLARLSA